MKNRETIYNLIINGLEGGSYSSFLVAGAWEKAWRAAEAEAPEAYAGITISDRYAAEEGYDVAGPPVALTDAALIDGWAKFQDKAPRHYADAIAENDDAITGDVFLQILAFGNIVYG